MKKIAIFTVLILLLGCDKEVPIISVFDFQLETLYVSNVVVNTPRSTEFTITPEKVVTTTTYSFRYVLTQGSGHFLNESGEMIIENEWRPLDELVFTFNYLPATAETHQVTIFVRDNSGTYEKTEILTYEVENNDFIFSATATSTDIIVGNPININFNVNQIGEGEVNYSMIFESSGTGTLDYDGVMYAPGEPIPITPGASSGNYIGNNGGIHDVTFTVSNDNTPPIIQEDIINVNFLDYIFEFNGSSSESSIYTGGITDINFTIDETEGNSPSYEMRYVINQGNGIIRDEMDNILDPNVYYPINDAPSGFTWTIEGTNVETVNISFYIRNHILNEESINVDIDVVQASDFNIITDYITEEIMAVGGGACAGVCQINYYTRARFVVTSVATGVNLTFMHLQRISDSEYISNTENDISLGGQASFNEETSPLLIPNEEYEVRFINTVTGEEIIKTFFTADAPLNENLGPCFCGG